MTIRLLAILLALSWTTGAVANPTTAPRTVVLDAPDALKALQQSNPALFDKIRRILDGLRRRPDAEVPHWMEVSFAARDISYVPVILTSHPPKRRLSFVLDRTRYEMILTLTDFGGAIVPLR